MRMNRFIGDFDLTSRSLVLSERPLINQIKNVLRMSKGDTIMLSDGKGREVIAEISEIRNDRIEVRIVEESKNLNEPDIRAVLYCSVLKKENFEWVVQKACEIGIKEITPIITERTIKTNINEERLKKIIKEAAEQSERKELTQLNATLDFSEAIQNAERDPLNLFFDRSGCSVKELTRGTGLPRRNNDKDVLYVNFFIGPEGGWSARELQRAREKDFTIVNLSRLNFRSETAAVIACYLVCQKLFT